MNRLLRLLCLGLAAGAALGAGTAAPAGAAFGLNGLGANFFDAGGSPQLSAGSHPYSYVTEFAFNTTGSPPVPDGQVKDLSVSAPVGLAGTPDAVPDCANAVFLEAGIKCPDATALGVAEFKIADKIENKPVFNLAPSPGEVAKFGFKAIDSLPVTVSVHVSTNRPYRIVATAENIYSQLVTLYSVKLTLWGNPASSAHDPERGRCAPGQGSSTCPVTLAERPFLTLPTSCGPPLTTEFRADPWQSPGVWTVPGIVETQGATVPPTPTGLSGCEQVGFGGSIDSSPTVTSAESSSGLNFELNLENPGLTDVNRTADSDIEKAIVSLPVGVTTNPAVASGLTACSQVQYESETINSDPGSGCPESSKIGSVEVETPLLEKTEAEGGGLKVLHGSIYVAKQHDNEFDNLLTIDTVIKDPELGILIRLAGRVEPDPVTGQLTTTFEDLPQFPFSNFRLHFRDGQRAPLVTPPVCGTYTTTALLFPYSNPGSALRQSASFSVDSAAGGGACATSAGALPNRPSFSAGTTNSMAGAYSSFLLNLARPDGSQQLSRISTTLPGGLLGKLAGIRYCPESGIAQAASRSGEGQGALELASPSCPDSSEVGTVAVGAGAGSEVLNVAGHAYLAGPYKGAALSLEIITPAIAGPFDLGVVAVRTALRIDPLTAQITAESDPIPPILHGLPLDVRSISLEMKRPDFTLNPTSCEPKAITGSAVSTLGAVAPLGQYFQASDCGALAFRPKLQVTLQGSTKRAGHPALKAVLNYPKGSGYSNVARAQVNLPHSEFIDQSNLNKTCTKPVLLESKCPAKSIYGKVKAWTPLLEKPLEGPVYLVGGFGFKLPALIAELNGQIRVLLVGKVDTGPNHGIRSTFEAVPDAPVEKFVLELKGGPKYSLLENSENLCAKPQRAIARFTAQSGAVEQSKPTIANQCGKGRKKKSRNSPRKKDRG